jgi:dephospho-CoA kinase
VLIIGLTGSIGMGKSTAAERFRFHGITVVDADAEVHKLYRGAAVAPIEEAFPGTTKDGEVDRAALAKALLADPAGFKRLEAIVHPLVSKVEKAALLVARQAGAAMAVVEVPLLFETGGDKRVDIVVVVSAPPEMQRERVLSRNGMTLEKLESLLVRQTPDAEKRARADFVVDTGKTIPETQAQIDKIIESLKERTGTAYARYWS